MPSKREVASAVGIGALVALVVARMREVSSSSAPELEPVTLPPKKTTTEAQVDFAFDDAALLQAGQAGSGRAYVPAGISTPAPLLVYLHGNNPSGVMHPWLGAAGGDLRKLGLGRVIAAPTQTKNASTSTTLWTRFALDAFVDAVEAATGVPIDRTRVVLAGHSGGACNLAGGIYRPLGKILPERVMHIDGCFDPRYGAALGKLGERVPVEAYFQRVTWPRDFDGFAKAYGARGVLEEIKGPFLTNPHEDIVRIALSKKTSLT